MDLHEMLENVDGPESFLEFVRQLHADRLSEVSKPKDAFGRGASGWENHTIEAFLDAAVSWGEDTDMGASLGLEDASAWKRCAVLLYCGKIYEGRRAFDSGRFMLYSVVSSLDEDTCSLHRISSIKVEWRTARRRPGFVAAEFVLDGCLLLDHCERSTKDSFDVVSPLGWTPLEYQISFVERLLLRQPALLISGRRELLVCPECADLDCGCISAEVSEEEDCFVWDEIGYENNYDPNMQRIFSMGRLVVSKAELLHQLREHVPHLE
jgi:hypothetical protein